MNYIVQRLQWSKIINLSRDTFPFNLNQLIANRLYKIRSSNNKYALIF